MVPLEMLAQWLDETLQTEGIPDYPNAYNGLQVSRSGDVRKVGSAVDASLHTIEQAAAQEVDLLIVHHGLFWQGVEPLTGAWRKKAALLLEHNLAVYSSHLPLDVHPLYGNNAVLSRKLGLQNIEPCFAWKGIHLGLVGETSLGPVAFADQLAEVLGAPPFVSLNGPCESQRVCVSTGGAGDQITKIHHYQSSSLLTGEGSHWTVPYAEDHALNLYYGGHYRTEVFGVEEISKEISRQFNLPTQFIPAVTFL